MLRHRAFLDLCRYKWVRTRGVLSRKSKKGRLFQVHGAHSAGNGMSQSLSPNGTI